jgi:hypothetical protein
MIEDEMQGEEPIESEQESASEYGDMAGLVRQQSSMPTGFDGMTEAQQNVAMGFSPWAHVGKNSQTAQLQAARQRMSVVRPQAQQKAPDPRMKDAQFYAGLGDYGAVESLMKSKGGAIFQMNEELELDDVDEQGKVFKRKYTFGPKGVYSYKGMNIPAHVMARKAGVGSIPFKGGDEAARNYRGTLSKLSKMNRELAQLESLYRKNTYLSSLDPSEDAAMARMLESSIKTDYLALMKDMKGMGGSVSDNDMAIASHMVPQRASSAITRLGGNELAILRNVRESAMRKAMEVGESNGLMLIDSSPKAKANSYFQKGVIDTQPR